MVPSTPKDAFDFDEAASNVPTQVRDKSEDDNDD